MRQLYPYQQKYISDLNTKAILAAELGTGKSLMAIYHYKKHAEGQPLLIIAPASKTRTGDWERELEHAGYDLAKLDYRIVSRERFTTGKSVGKKPLWQEFAPAYNKGKQYAVIVDEIHIGGRNPNGAFAKKLMPVIRNASFFIGLTATPIPNGWQDSIGYAVLFGFKRNATEFKNRYFNIVRYKGWPEIVGYFNVEELEQWWASLAKPLSRAEANELPPRQFVGIDLDTPELYYKTKATRILGEEMLDSPSKLLHGLRQTLADNKMDSLQNILEGTDENVLVWYNYNTERDAILELLSKMKDKTVFEVTGHNQTAPDHSKWAETKNSVTLCQYKSASAGIELTYATVSVYFSPTYSWAEYSQSLGRNYREGQKNKVLVYNFRTLRTVEEDVYRALRNKKDFNKRLWAEKEYKPIDNV